MAEKRKCESDFTTVGRHSKRPKSSKAEKENTIDTLIGNISTKSLLWDSMDLNLESNKENVIEFDHICLKDEKISKVSQTHFEKKNLFNFLSKIFVYLKVTDFNFLPKNMN